MKHLIILLCLLCACTPQARLDRLAKRHPTLFTKDSLRITVRDTVITKERLIDTSHVFNSSRKDSFIVHKDNMRLVVYKHFDTVWVRAEAGRDTTIIERTIAVPQTTANLSKRTFWDELQRFWWLGLLVIVAMVWLTRKRYKAI